MTRYTTHNRRESRNATKTVFAVLICAVMAFAILMGFIKSFSLPIAVDSSNFKWDNKSSFAIALDTSPPSVFIYQKEPRRIVFLGLAKNMYFITGNPKTPIAEIGGAISGGSDSEISRVLSLSFGVPITSYVTFNKQENLDSKTVQKMFKDFASLATPFVIITQGKPGYLKNTNITRYDAMRLWWQVKGFSVESANVTDLSTLSEEVVTGGRQKVLGADTVSLNREIRDFMENINIEKEGYNISILNESGNQYAAVVAADFIGAVGGNLVGVKEEKTVRDNSQIITHNGGDYTPSYLAKMFGCDIRELVSRDLEIKEAQNAGSDRELTVVLGRDFVKKYFK